MALHSNWLLAGLFSLATSPATAGQVIEQSVKVSLNGSVHMSSHSWNIDGDRFDLVVTTAGNERRFIFNGRVMYACGKLEPTQIKALGDLNIKDESMVKKFKSGVCQEVPSNFLVRFFLSPVSAIETIDLSDGLKLTLEIDDFKVTETQTKKIAGVDVRGFSRSFALKKSGSIGKTNYTIKESFFAGGEFKAKQKLWAELSKNLMRQAKGIQLLRELKKDRKQVSGMIYESETIFTSEQPGGGKNSGTISVTTVKTGAAELSAVRFKIPHDYEVFSPESLRLIAQASENSDTAKSNDKKDEVNILDKMQSVFFCAISGALACFSK